MCCPILKSLDALSDKVSLNVGAAPAPLFFGIHCSAAVSNMVLLPVSANLLDFFPRGIWGGINTFHHSDSCTNLSLCYIIWYCFFFFFSPASPDNIIFLCFQIMWGLCRQIQHHVRVWYIKVLKSKVSCTCLKFLEDSILFVWGDKVRT